MDSHKQIRLFVTREIRSTLEKRRLTDEEIQKILFEAEKTGKKFVNTQSGHFLAGIRYGATSVWVEYSPREDGFEIHKAYQYRLQISSWDLKTGRTR